jgi:peroxiredoxin
VRQLGLPFRLGSDAAPPGGVGKAWGVWDDTWNLEQRVTFVVDRRRRIRHVEIGGLAIDTGRTLEALTRLARAK